MNRTTSSFPVVHGWSSRMFDSSSHHLPPYPSQAFYPGLPGEIMSRLVNSGIPAQLVGTVLIAIISLLTQGVADMVWPNGLRTPIGVSGAVIAPSGFGKSLILKILIGTIEQVLRRLVQMDERIADFLVENATRAAIVESLANFPVAGLLTDETEQVQDLLRHTGTLIKLQDGSTLRNARISSGRVTLYAPRLVMLLMMQPSIFDATKHLLGVKNGGPGLGNRFFFAPCIGLIAGGDRHQIGLSDAIKSALEEKVVFLLGETVKQVQQPDKGRPAICLGKAATQFTKEMETDVRRNSAPGARLSFISEYLARHVERVVRLAGTMHVFEHGAGGEVSIDTIQRAAEFGQWYAEAFAQLNYEPPSLTQAATDAIRLEAAAHDIFARTGLYQFRQSEMRAGSLNLGLTPARFTRALAALAEQEAMRIVMQDKSPWVVFNVRPSYNWW